MDNFNIHKFVREQYLNENRGVDAANKIIAQLREKVYRKLNDDEMYEFRKVMADHISADLREEEDVKPTKETIPAYKVILTYVDGGRNQFYGLYIYKDQSSKNWDHKLKYDQAKAFLAKYNIKPELPQFQDSASQ
jgi:hypothetical protein